MDNRPIGVFDSGLGGLTVVKELMNKLPDESIIYFGDTGRVPYGTRSSETIIKYAVQDINFLITQNVKAVIIACGTASSVALDYVTEKYDLPVIGVVSSTAKAAVQATVNKRVGIIGTSGTISSGSYEKKLMELDGEIEVISQACPLFVPLVENGYTNNEVAYLVAQDYLKPLKNKGVDTIILGCTHYPLLNEVISDIMGSNVVLINSGIPMSAYVKDFLSCKDMLSGGNAKYKYFVSDTISNFSYYGSLFMQKEISDCVKRIDIDQY